MNSEFFLKIKRHFLWQICAVFVIALPFYKNLMYLEGYIYGQTLDREEEYRDFPPGRSFLPLVPYLNLKHVSVAGYYTDRYDMDFWFTSDAGRRFQRAQYSLAPTVIDAEHWFNRDYVIFDCADSGCEKAVMREHGLTYVMRILPHIILTKRKDP